MVTGRPYVWQAASRSARSARSFFPGPMPSIPRQPRVDFGTRVTGTMLPITYSES